MYISIDEGFMGFLYLSEYGFPCYILLFFTYKLSAQSNVSKLCMVHGLVFDVYEHIIACMLS